MVRRPISYVRHRFPPDIICRAAWLYLRFTLSYRDVEDLLAARAWASATRPSAAGSRSLVRRSREICDIRAPDLMVSGTSMKWSYRSMAVPTHAAVYNTFNVQRHLISRPTLRRVRRKAMRTWNAATAALCDWRGFWASL
jgi:hypothetical protein